MSDTPKSSDGGDKRRDLAGMVGWGVLLAVAAALLLMRFFGGGGC